MWAVSDRFRQAPTRSVTLATTVTLTTPGGSSQTLPLSSGSVAVDRSQQIRRTASLAVKGGTDLYTLLATPGATVRIDAGYAWSSTDREVIPVLSGGLTSASLPLGDGLVSFSVADRWQQLAAQEYLTPFTPATTASRLAVIATAVQEAFPGITIRNTASDLGLVATSQSWTSRADMIAALATDAGVEAFFAPDGAFVIRNVPAITDAPAWLIKTGPGGTLKTLTRSKPLDKLYNTVVLTPGTADASQGWTSATAQISDPGNPRHPSRIGVRPYRTSSPTLLTLADAQTVAGQILTRVQGTTETLSVSAMGMSALEGGDIARVVTIGDRGQEIDIVTHYLQQLSLDLVAGDMSASTVSSIEVAA